MSLGAIFEPYLIGTGLVAALVGFRAANTFGRALVVLFVTLAISIYAPVFVSPPTTVPSDALRVSSWNVHAGRDASARTLDGIKASEADLIALQELQPGAAGYLTPAATGFPFRALAPDLRTLDLGLLSRDPVVDSEVTANGLALRVVVDPPATDPLVVYVIHPPLAKIAYLGGFPVGLDLTVRDIALDRIKARLDEDITQGSSVIVMGDFNTTSREGAYSRFSAGLADAHVTAGIGPGFTWRPDVVEYVPLGLLRIDYVLSTPDLVATSATVDCSVPSDHCRLDVALQVTPTGP
jgi:vancomycin resistance protein VanJ